MNHKINDFVMKTLTKVKILTVLSIIFSIPGCTSFISINRHNNGSCQHLDYTNTNELKSDSSQYTINND